MLSIAAQSTHHSMQPSLRWSSQARNTVCQASRDAGGPGRGHSSEPSDTAWDAAHMPMLRRRISDLESKIKKEGAGGRVGPGVNNSKSDSFGPSPAPVWIAGQHTHGKPHSFRDEAWMTQHSSTPPYAPRVPTFKSAWRRPGPTVLSGPDGASRASPAAAGAPSPAADAQAPRLPLDQDLTKVSQEEWAAKCNEVDAWIAAKWAELDGSDDACLS
eukprot:jgi/Ulvmu1/10632/UM066_0011.1